MNDIIQHPEWPKIKPTPMSDADLLSTIETVWYGLAKGKGPSWKWTVGQYATVRGLPVVDYLGTLVELYELRQRLAAPEGGTNNGTTKA